VSSSGISWAICKSASRSRQMTTTTPHHSFFYRLDALPAAQPTASKHWRDKKHWRDIKRDHLVMIIMTRKWQRRPYKNSMTCESQAYNAYAVKVAMSGKWCKFVETANRNWIMPFPMILSDLEDCSLTAHLVRCNFFVQSSNSWQDFKLFRD